MIDLSVRRRCYADEIEAVARLRSRALVEALAAVPRERFLGPGPWTTLTDADFAPGGLGPARQTPDADPARVYHNVGVAIDPARQLFNGQPATLAPWIDALAPDAGQRVLHVGAGLGYYTAVMAHCVGPAGRVLALEADPALADAARANLADLPHVDVRADASGSPDGETFDGILINAGVTHPLGTWLDALAPGGRMILPLTATMGAMGPIGKGLVFLVIREPPDGFGAKVTGFVAVYSAVGLRDDFLNAQIGRKMMAGPQQWGAVTRLRRDHHEPSLSCWLHGAGFCLSA